MLGAKDAAKMAHAPVDLHVPGVEAYASYEGPDLVLYVIHDRTTPEQVRELKGYLVGFLLASGKFSTYRLKARGNPNAGWS
jgi:hypothetical protein